jgi:methylmalonyl-CoA mutase N-terminal domain/subunit
LSLTAQQPVNNIVRGAVQALALALAGVQAAEISAFDEAFRTPSEEAHLVGLRTQQIIDLETGVMSVQDPLGGSHYVESLTDEMENRIVAMVREIEARGGLDELADKGFFREIFQNAMRRDQADVFAGRRRVVGVNVHRMDPAKDRLLRDLAETKIAPFRERIDEVREFKASRARGPWAEALRGVHAATSSDQSLMPSILEAYAADATLEEVHGAMRIALGLSYDGYGRVQSPLEFAA